MFRRDVLIRAASLSLTAVAPLHHAHAALGVTAAQPYRWASLPLGGGGFVNGLCFHPRERGLLYARSDVGGIYRYESDTTQWVPLLDELGMADGELMSVLSLALDPNDADRVYAACGARTDEWARNGALLISTDRGRSWTTRDLAVKLGGAGIGRGTGERLQVDPHLSTLLLLGTTQNGLLRSMDRGQTFQPLSFGSKHVSLVMFDPSSAAPDSGCRRIWVGSHDQPGLYVSEDAGASFSRVPGLPRQVPQRAVMARDRALYVTFAMVDVGARNSKSDKAQAGSVWRRDRNGQWTDITPSKIAGDDGKFGFSGIDVDPRVPSRVVVSTIDRWTPRDEMFLSLDSGQTWTSLVDQSSHNTGPYPWLEDQMRRAGRPGWWISDLKIDPFDSAHMIYGTGYGLWETRNLGAARKEASSLRWEFMVKGMELTSATEIRSPSGGATLLAAMGVVVGGAAWDQIDATPKAGLFSPQGESSVSVDYAEGAPAIIARTCQVDVGGRISLDGGASWRPFGEPTVKPGADQPRGGRIAVSARGGFMVWAPAGQPVLCSRDRGKSWEPCAGLPERHEADLVPVSDRTIEGIFYVYDIERGRILQSLDGGRNFASAIVRLPVLNQWQANQLVCAPGKLRDLWLALPNGLVNLPGGDQAARGIKKVMEARLIALGKAAPGADYHTLYVWGRVEVDGIETNGLFQSTDRGTSFTRIDDEGHRYGRLLSITADPLEFGVVYLAPQGRGVVVGRPRGAA